MKRNYVRVKTMGGFDQHDFHYEEKHLLENDSLTIQNVADVIAANIRKNCPIKLNSTINHVCHNPGSSAVMTLFDEKHGMSGKFTIENSKKNGITASLGSQVSYYDCYVVKEIDDKDVCFLPVMQYYTRYNPDINEHACIRFFHEPFSSYEDAKKYLEATQRPDAANLLNLSESERYDDYSIFVFDKNSLNHLENEWYRDNMSAIALMEQTGYNRFSSTFRANVKDHIRELLRIEEYSPFNEPDDDSTDNEEE